MAPSGSRGGAPQAAATAKAGSSAISTWARRLVEAEPLHELGGLSLGYFEQKAVSCRDNKKSNRIFPCGVSRPAWMAPPGLRLVDIVGDQPLQKLRAAGPETRTTARSERSAALHWLISGSCSRDLFRRT
mgnify:CR=1 FL=1